MRHQARHFAGTADGRRAGRARRRLALLAASAWLVPLGATATEASGSAYPHGAEGWSAGLLPPPGDYLVTYTNAYQAGRLLDGKGEDAVPDFRVRAYAQSFRFVHVWDRKVLGGDLASQVLVPLVDLDVRGAGRSDHRRGLGDIVVNPVIVGWHRGRTHVIAAMDIYLPTGRYGRDRLANLGRNVVTFEPVLAVTYLDPEGPEVSAKLMYALNTRNGATGYRSGDELHVDFVAGWAFRDVSVGVSGYYDRQLTDDRQHGRSVGHRGEVFALGPSLRYQWGRIPVMLTWQHEFEARNRPEGDKVWLKFAVPLAAR